MPFTGFPNESNFIRIPARFFTELLPEIDHLAELQLTLYVFWRLERMEGAFRFIRRGDLLEDQRFLSSLGKEVQGAATVLDAALERAVLRGTLLRAVPGGEESEALYFLNSPRGRAALQAIQDGTWSPVDIQQLPLELVLERPNIFRLYEQHIGPLTPMISESLQDAEQAYPADWIEEAFRISVEYNKRNWRYIEAILRRWQEGGRHERQDRRDSEADRRRYARWDTSGDEQP